MAGDRSDDLGVSSPGLPAHYEIRVDGVLDHRWAAWFGGLHVKTDGTQTVISGLLTDQPALHGLPNQAAQRWSRIPSTRIS